ncbi:hypothetical protein ACCD01_30910, partial [Telluria sp. Tellsp99]
LFPRFFALFLAPTRPNQFIAVITLNHPPAALGGRLRHRCFSHWRGTEQIQLQLIWRADFR